MIHSRSRKQLLLLSSLLLTLIVGMMLVAVVKTQASKPGEISYVPVGQVFVSQDQVVFMETENIPSAVLLPEAVAQNMVRALPQDSFKQIHTDGPVSQVDFNNDPVASSVYNWLQNCGLKYKGSCLSVPYDVFQAAYTTMAHGGAPLWLTITWPHIESGAWHDRVESGALKWSQVKGSNGATGPWQENVGFLMEYQCWPGSQPRDPLASACANSNWLARKGMSTNITIEQWFSLSNSNADGNHIWSYQAKNRDMYTLSVAIKKAWMDLQAQADSSGYQISTVTNSNIIWMDTNGVPTASLVFEPDPQGVQTVSQASTAKPNGKLVENNGAGKCYTFDWPTGTAHLAGYWFGPGHPAYDLHDGKPNKHIGLEAVISGNVTTSGGCDPVGHLGNGCGDGYGNYAVLTSGKIRIIYGHLSQIKVENGQYVNAGDIVGDIGSSGNSSGEHLHFEVRFNGVGIPQCR